MYQRHRGQEMSSNTYYSDHGARGPRRAFTKPRACSPTFTVYATYKPLLVYRRSGKRSESPCDLRYNSPLEKPVDWSVECRLATRREHLGRGTGGRGGRIPEPKCSARKRRGLCLELRILDEGQRECLLVRIRPADR